MVNLNWIFVDQKISETYPSSGRTNVKMKGVFHPRYRLNFKFDWKALNNNEKVEIPTSPWY